MNASKIVTVVWLNELAPGAEQRDIAMQQFEKQTGNPATKVVLMADLGIWGLASADAVMLFKVPADFNPESETPK